MTGTGELHPNPEDTLTPADLGLDLRVTQPDPAWLQHRACTPGSLHGELTADAAGYARQHGDRWIVGVHHDDDGINGGWWTPGMPLRRKPKPTTPEPRPASLFDLAFDGIAAHLAPTPAPTPEAEVIPDPPKVGRADVIARESYTDDVRAAKAQCLACPVMTQCRASAVYIAPVSGVAGGWTETQRDTYRAHNGIPAPDDGLDRTDPGGLCLAVLNDVRALSEAGVDAGRIADYFDSPEIDDTTVDYARQILAGSKTPAWATNPNPKGAAA